MARSTYKKSEITRGRILDAARDLAQAQGYGAFRIDDITAHADVAKGTFFTHFTDKDTLLAELIGQRLNALLDDMEMRQLPPASLEEFADRLMPMATFLSSDRTVFDIFLKYSGAMSREQIGPVAETFIRQVQIYTKWIAQGAYRDDVAPPRLAEGVLAFLIHLIALKFCAVHKDEPLRSELIVYLTAWLIPSPAA